MEVEKLWKEVFFYLEENLDRLSSNQEKLVEEIVTYLASCGYKIDKKLKKLVISIIEENRKFNTY